MNKPEKKCKYCDGDIEIRNPTGNCDHLYYPENVNKSLKKPEKKTDKDIEPTIGTLTPINYGYNLACDDYEAFLPSEEEIMNLIFKNHNGNNCDNEPGWEWTLGKAISKRIKR